MKFQTLAFIFGLVIWGSNLVFAAGGNSVTGGR